MRRSIALAAVAALIAVGWLAYHGSLKSVFPPWLSPENATAQTQNATPSGRRGGRGAVAVTTATATTGDMPIRRTTIGWIHSVASTTVTTQQQGLVLSIAASNGQEVKAGDLLVQLDDRAAEATLSRDQAALARDQAAVVSTRADLTRAQDLVKRQVDSAQQLDQATAAANAADAVIKLDQANIAADQVVVDDMKIRAPHDGRLGAFQITVGSLVQPGNPVVTLTDVDRIEADFTISDADVDLLRQSLAAGPVTVHVTSTTAAAAGAPKPASADGKVDFIDSAIDPTAGSISVRAAVPNGGRLFWPGEAVTVDADLGVHRNVVIVPTVAVQQGQAGSNVFVVKADSTIEVRPVEVAGILGDKAGLSSGLKEGETVVTEGQLSLAPGMMVTVRQPKAGNDAPKGQKTPKPAAGAAS